MEETTKYFKYAMLFPVIVCLLVTFIMTYLLNNNNYAISYGNSTIQIYTGFIWPTPQYKRISSQFGRRVSPTVGASSYHQGIDIAAAQGTSVLAISTGIVTFAGWNGSGRIHYYN